MNAHRTLIFGILATSLSFTTILTASAAAADSGADVSDYGSGCYLDPGNRAATIDSLRFRCSAEQQDAIFHDAPRGAVPMGVTNGWVIRPVATQTWAPVAWIGKTFYTGPDGGRLMNRLTPAGIEALPADVYTAPAILDGGPTWVLNYAPSPIPQIYDEIREITPGVWFGYSWWRDTAAETMLLVTFALTN
ncbi:hypothetical protein OG874_33890 [Nocardia sp. NBC_00565]|uniref:hypothetical protein n=1 Tax=Nocardia sp. NBC_00565 TaxID=2975993 RepID=UPI002E8226EA|nr:hypothetical protein [Nocardia sp. NBC_00565]WUC01726.1 hypothetical protein OG874_33890 [Nocardia sp. NBC_00565]